MPFLQWEKFGRLAARKPVHNRGQPTGEGDQTFCDRHRSSQSPFDQGQPACVLTSEYPMSHLVEVRRGRAESSPPMATHDELPSISISPSSNPDGTDVWHAVGRGWPWQVEGMGFAIY